jgi:hypothetical protein
MAVFCRTEPSHSRSLSWPAEDLRIGDFNYTGLIDLHAGGGYTGGCVAGLPSFTSMLRLPSGPFLLAAPSPSLMKATEGI